MAALYVVTVAAWIAASTLKVTAIAGGVFWALIVRLIYVRIRRRSGREHPYWSPWLFVLAAVFSAFSLIAITQRENDETDRAAVARGIAIDTSDVTPEQRCLTKMHEGLEGATAAQRALLPRGFNSYARGFCAKAERMGVLASNGLIEESDAFDKSICVDVMMLSFRQVPKRERAFTAGDFLEYSKRFCDRAVERDLMEGGRFGRHRAEIEELQQSVLAEMEATGAVTRLR